MTHCSRRTLSSRSSPAGLSEGQLRTEALYKWLSGYWRHQQFSALGSAPVMSIALTGHEPLWARRSSKMPRSTRPPTYETSSGRGWATARQTNREHDIRRWHRPARAVRHRPGARAPRWSRLRGQPRTGGQTTSRFGHHSRLSTKSQRTVAGACGGWRNSTPTHVHIREHSGAIP